MDPILSTLFSWQFVVYSMAIAAVIFVIRTAAEYAMANWAAAAKESKIWNDLILPILPVFVGALAGAVIKIFPYPNGLTATGGRIMFGLVAGLLSTLLYRVFKALLNQKSTNTGYPNYYGGGYSGGYPYPGGYPQPYPTVQPPGMGPTPVLITPDNPANPLGTGEDPEQLAAQVRQTINKG